MLIFGSLVSARREGKVEWTKTVELEEPTPALYKPTLVGPAFQQQGERRDPPDPRPSDPAAINNYSALIGLRQFGGVFRGAALGIWRDATWGDVVEWGMVPFLAPMFNDIVQHGWPHAGGEWWNRRTVGTADTVSDTVGIWFHSKVASLRGRPAIVWNLGDGWMDSQTSGAVSPLRLSEYIMTKIPEANASLGLFLSASTGRTL